MEQQQAVCVGAAKQYPRFYAPVLPQTVGSCIDLEPDEARHAVKVLRLKQGHLVELCDGRGGVALSEVAYTSKNAASVSAYRYVLGITDTSGVCSDCSVCQRL